jgi:aminopeptidase
MNFMYVPKLSDFPSFSLERLLKTCFSLPCGDLKSCVLIDLHDLESIKGCAFLQTTELAVQKRAHDYFFKPLSGDVGKSLGIQNCDLFAFKPTGGSNLDPDNFLISTNGDEVTFSDHICPEYDLVFAITDYSLTAPLTAMAKKHHFRGATLHGLNDIILNSGLSIDYNLVSRQAELFRSYLDKADSFKISFECFENKYQLEIQCGGQTAQKSHGICPPGTPDIANLPAGEVYFVPHSASGSFPFRFPDGTISEMHVKDGAITHADLIKGEESIVASRNLQLSEDPATGILGELGFGTQVLPFAGCDIQDEKILGTCHIATGRSDHLGGNLTPELFNSRENASHDDILYAPPKTPEINVNSVVMVKSGQQVEILQNFCPTSLLLDVLDKEYPTDLIRSALQYS